MVSTSFSVATLTTVPGCGAWNSLHRGAVEVLWTIDVPLDSFGPSRRLMHNPSQRALNTVSGTAAAQVSKSKKGETRKARNNMVLSPMN